MTDAHIAVRVICSFICCISISMIVGFFLGHERKEKWFKKRQIKYFLLNRRGFMGEHAHFGRPRTKEGVMVSLGLFASFALVTYIIFII